MAAIRKQKIRHLLQGIIDIYSPSGKEEEVLDFVYRYLTKENIPVIRQEIDESRYNIVVVPPDADPQLVFVGHLDTVAASDLDHYNFVRKGNTVSGLGSAADLAGRFGLDIRRRTFWEDSLRVVEAHIDRYLAL